MSNQTAIMNPTLKAKWIEALRSGKYKQGTGILKKLNGEYCCLGVLCELVELPFLVYGPNIGFRFPYRGTSMLSATQPPSDIPFLGIPSSKIVELVNKNDGGNGERQHSFSEIADIIDNTL